MLQRIEVVGHSALSHPWSAFTMKHILARNITSPNASGFDVQWKTQRSLDTEFGSLKTFLGQNQSVSSQIDGPPRAQRVHLKSETASSGPNSSETSSRLARCRLVFVWNGNRENDAFSLWCAFKTTKKGTPPNKTRPLVYNYGGKRVNRSTTGEIRHWLPDTKSPRWQCGLKGTNLATLLLCGSADKGVREHRDIREYRSK